MAAAAGALALLLAPAGCGGDKEKKGGDRATPPTATETAPSPTGTQTQSTGAGTERTGTAPKSPESQPGGAGDEQPARVPASFSGRAGRISPRAVHVPPYIAVLVQLRSADGRAYGLRFPGAVLRTGAARKVDSATLDGLRPGRSVSGTPLGGGSPVRIVADAEPGP